MSQVWATLPSPIDRELWMRMDARAKGGIRKAFGGTGISYRLDGDRVLVAASPVDALYASPLQNADGRLRADVESRLARDSPEVDLAPGIRRFAEEQGTDLELLGRHERTQLAIITLDDALPLLKELAERKDMSLYRIALRNTGWRRFSFWQMIEALARGVAPEDFSFIKTARPLSDGALAAYPSLVCMGPLTARHQPTAMIYTLRTGAQIAAISRAGGGFHRDLNLPAWPVGWSSESVGGGGKGAFVGAPSFTPSYGEAMLKELVRGANKLIAHVTDPGHWMAADGTVDLDERLIVWGSIRFGLDAVKHIAENYGAPSSIWEAFRALSTLQGIWEGSNQGAVPLGWLLDPATIRSKALPHIANSEHQVWASAVVGNYDSAIASTFGSTTPTTPGQPSDAARFMAEIRNLVHGVGAQGRRERNARLTALHHIDSTRANLELVRDIAVLWWTAALCAPDVLLTAGYRPFGLR